MSLEKSSPRLFFVLLITFSLFFSACSYVPWVGDEDEDDLAFEDDISSDDDFGDSDFDDEDQDIDDFFADEGDGDADEFEKEFASVEQETNRGELKGDLESLQAQHESLKSKVRGLEEIIETMEANQDRLDSGAGSADLEPEINELKAQVALLNEEIERMKAGRGYSRASRPTRSSFRRSSGTPPQYQRALAAYQRGNYDESILLFQEFSSKNPPFSLKDNVHFWVGNNYVKLEMFNEAIKQFETVISDYPSGNKVHDSRYMLGVTYHKKGDSGRALDILETALKYNPPGETRRKIEKQLLVIQ